MRLLLLVLTVMTIANAAVAKKMAVDDEPDAVKVDRPRVRLVLDNALRVLKNDPRLRQIVLSRYPQVPQLIEKELSALNEIYIHRTDNEIECFPGVRWQDDPGNVAYVHLDNRRIEGVNICPYWYKLSEDSQMHTVIHEFAHVLGIDDEDVADAVAVTALFLNGKQAMTSKFSKKMAKLRDLWKTLYVETFKPDFIVPTDEAHPYIINVPKELRSLKGKRMSIVSKDHFDGFEISCSFESKNGLMPLDQDQFKFVASYESIFSIANTTYNILLNADNMTVFCMAESAVPLSRQMLEYLFGSENYDVTVLVP